MAEMTIAARTENLSEVLAFIDERLEELNCPMKVQIQLDVAVEEIFVNIASYAYAPEEGTATIRFECGDDGSRVAITFMDAGVPYNPLEKADPDTTLKAEDRQIGGLGIYMVKRSMDDTEYEYRDGMNVFTIKKNIAL